MRFHFVDQDHDSVGGGLIQDLRGFEMLLLGPDQPVSHAENPLDRSGSMDDGDRPVRHFEGGYLADIREADPHRLTRPQDLLFARGEAAQDVFELLEGPRAFQLPDSPVLNQSLAQHALARFEPIPKGLRRKMIGLGQLWHAIAGGAM